MSFWSHQCLVRENGDQQKSSGCLKALQMQTGHRTRDTAVQQAAEIHLVCGAFAYGSSRTQKVISLSSCASELHAMVSTLCDGIFLRRCLEFLTGTVIEHFLFTDSSSAKQLASRQGVGKVKHIAGKLLWVQDTVSQKTSCTDPSSNALESERHWNEASWSKAPKATSA